MNASNRVRMFVIRCPSKLMSSHGNRPKSFRNRPASPVTTIPGMHEKGITLTTPETPFSA
jgi:hypothetical protein